MVSVYKLSKSEHAYGDEIFIFAAKMVLFTACCPEGCGTLKNPAVAMRISDLEWGVSARYYNEGGSSLIALHGERLPPPLDSKGLLLHGAPHVLPVVLEHIETCEHESCNATPGYPTQSTFTFIQHPCHSPSCKLCWDRLLHIVFFQWRCQTHYTAALEIQECLPIMLLAVSPYLKSVHS